MCIALAQYFLSQAIHSGRVIPIQMDLLMEHHSQLFNLVNSVYFEMIHSDAEAEVICHAAYVEQIPINHLCNSACGLSIQE